MSKQDPKDFWYQMTFNGDQARSIAQALDFYTRCSIGQLDQLNYLNHRVDNIQEVDHYIAILKKLLFPDLGVYDCKFDDKGHLKECFNLRKVIEYAYSWNETPLKPGQFMTVNYDGPLESYWKTYPAKVKAVVGDEALKIKDNLNRGPRLVSELSNLLGTDDIEEAVELLTKWKAAYEKQTKKPKPKKEKWQFNSYRKEWICEHGVGHYDPRYVKNTTHGCDGCCGLASFPPNKESLTNEKQ